ncbi:MAG: efflux RND transporter periplasmic adaptor subunit [Candidatus Neomarinimicrobiota bacterium]
MKTKDYFNRLINWFRILPYRVWIIVGLAFILGLLITGPGREEHEHGQIVVAAATHGEVRWWTCSMHPQVQLPEPGQCPICFMDLIPVANTGSEAAPRELRMSENAIALAGITTQRVHRAVAEREVRLAGKVDYDETLLANITAWVPGRLERLFVDYTGITVKKGDHLVELYSPELYAAQEELIQALQRVPAGDQAPGRAPAQAIVQAAREKLRLLGITENQIKQIEQRSTPSDRLTIYSPMSGIVIHKDAVEGMYVSTGTRIYSIADLSRVWVILEAYESDLPWLHYGQEVDFTVEALPGQTFRGRVAFIDPVLDTKTRAVKVRLSQSNPTGVLKPGMFVRATVHSVLDAEGRVINADMAGKWVSPMHPEIVKDHPGQCDICGMDLVRAEDLGIVNIPASEQLPLLVPASAVLLTGKRAVVYVKKPDIDEPTFEGREVRLGARAGDSCLVLSGLKEGEEVVVNGNFKIDSAMQIAAKPSMMSPVGGISMTGHEHHAVEGKQHESTPNARVEDTQTEPIKPEAEATFLEALQKVYDLYFQAQDALADDRIKAATDALVQLKKEAQAIQPELSGLKGPTAQVWQDHQEQLLTAMEHVHHWRSPEAARSGFDRVSLVIIAVQKDFGHADDRTYYELFCPMAFDNTGAHWLQTDKAVKNPYFGNRMLRCGEVRSVMPPAQTFEKEPSEGPTPNG